MSNDFPYFLRNIFTAVNQARQEMANVLVTGGTGQIGAFVCTELAEKYHAVTIYDFKPNSENISEIAKKIEILSGDVLDLEDLLSVIKTRHITHIIHLAALLVLESKQRPAKALRVNCIGTNNIFEAARLTDLKRVVFASSVVVYGLPSFYPGGRVDEDDFPHCPNDPYSYTKFLNESMGQFYRETFGLDLLCMRITGAWGPGRYWGYTGQFNDFVRKVAVGEAAELPVDFAYSGARLRWLYVKEMASCLAYASLAEKSKVKRGLYNVGSRKPFKAPDLVRAIKDFVPLAEIKYSETDSPTKLSSDIAGPSGLDVDCRRLYEELGFEEKIGLKEGVKDMIEFERRRAGLRPI